jgi:hypothetical protein
MSRLLGVPVVPQLNETKGPVPSAKLLSLKPTTADAAIARALDLGDAAFLPAATALRQRQPVAFGH